MPHILAVALRAAARAVWSLRDRVSRDDRCRRVAILAREHADRVGVRWTLGRFAVAVISPAGAVTPTVATTTTVEAHGRQAVSSRPVAGTAGSDRGRGSGGRFRSEVDEAVFALEDVGV